MEIPNEEGEIWEVSDVECRAKGGVVKSMRFWLPVSAALAVLLVASAASAGPAPGTFKLPKVVGWMLNAGGPCPDCDAAQTWVGRKETPLPSPLPPRRRLDPAAGAPRIPGPGAQPEPAARPNPLDEMDWSKVRQLLPAGLKR